MEINAGTPPALVNNYSAPLTTPSADGSKSEAIAPDKPEAAEGSQNKSKHEIELTNDEVSQVTDELNKFMDKINTDLKFEIHEKTNRVIVQVVDSKDQRVIKEFPPHELLDTLAAISDYIGVLLDKRV